MVSDTTFPIKRAASLAYKITPICQYSYLANSPCHRDHERVLALTLFARDEAAHPFFISGGRAHRTIRPLRELPHHACGGIMRGRNLSTHRDSDADQYRKMGSSS